MWYLPLLIASIQVFDFLSQVIGDWSVLLIAVASSCLVRTVGPCKVNNHGMSVEFLSTGRVQRAG